MMVRRLQATWVMWVIPNAICTIPQENHHELIGGINLPFPVMGGLWHCFTHINVNPGLINPKGPFNWEVP